LYIGHVSYRIEQNEKDIVTNRLLKMTIVPIMAGGG